MHKILFIFIMLNSIGFAAEKYEDVASEAKLVEEVNDIRIQEIKKKRELLLRRFKLELEKNKKLNYENNESDGL